ncbi:hypothetical protein [Rheinheimera sp.]|uniref:hypothetical protein n=1 Tax=Rheinheimera sp. TaxID=1869214 RepID=UPI003D27F792
MAPNTVNSDLIQSPGWRQAGQVFMLFILAMLFANALLLLLESRLGLYSYFAAPQLELLTLPIQWFCQVMTQF